jgi:hypothetical protein
MFEFEWLVYRFYGEKKVCTDNMKRERQDFQDDMLEISGLLI